MTYEVVCKAVKSHAKIYTRLESVCSSNVTEGSNPSLSAIRSVPTDFAPLCEFMGHSGYLVFPVLHS